MIAVIFGPPGSGKGTQSERIRDAFSVKHVSTGAMLRAEVERGTPVGREVGPIMQGGQLVPDDLILQVIEARLKEDDARGGVLLDGFPRTVPQAEALDAMLARQRTKLDVVLVLDVPEEALVERIIGRAHDEGRADDTLEAIRTRMREYEDKTAPVLAYYRGRGVPLRRVDGVGGIDEVAARVREALVGVTA